VLGKVRVLLLHPEFAMTFWWFKSVLDLMGRKALDPPLGLITVAAILPQEWEFMLVDCAVRPPTEANGAFAAIVLLTGMIVQKPSMMALIAESPARQGNSGGWAQCHLCPAGFRGGGRGLSGAG